MGDVELLLVQLGDRLRRSATGRNIEDGIAEARLKDDDSFPTPASSPPVLRDAERDRRASRRIDLLEPVSREEANVREES